MFVRTDEQVYAVFGTAFAYFSSRQCRLSRNVESVKLSLGNESATLIE